MKTVIMGQIFHILCIGFLLHSVASVVEKEPKMITTDNIDYRGFMKDFRKITCQARGTNLRYSWKHNDILITPAYILKFPETNSSILAPLLANVDTNYQGAYQCFVTNSIGTIFGRKAFVKFTALGEFVDKNTNRLEKKKVTLGTWQAIHCPPHNLNNNVTYSWNYKVGNDFRSFPDDPNHFVTKNGTLYFAIMRQKDIDFIKSKDGIYCTQRAVAGRAESIDSHRIELYSDSQVSPPYTPYPPQIKTVIGTHSVNYGTKKLTLACGAIGHPTPNLKWYRVDSVSNIRTEIKNGDSFKLERYNQLLTVKDVTSEKSGQYVCVASNTKGKVEAFGKISVSERPQWVQGGELTNVQPPINSRFEWMCGALGGVSYNWYRNGVEMTQRLSPDGKVEIKERDGMSYLIFHKVTKELDGMYQCTAENEVDTLYSAGWLHVTKRKPEFIKRMGPILLIRSLPGLIACPAVASPEPTIVWRKNDLQLVVKDGGPLKLAANKRDLIITNVTDDDAGKYLCRAENELGTAEDHSVVTVGADITFTSAPVSNRNVTVTLRYELDCKAEGHESYEVKYRWLRNGLPLEYSARVHWVKEEHKLVILDALVSDTGTYTCVAFAETPLYIEERKDVDIVVKGPADPPDIVRLDGDCWKKDATLTWKDGSLNNEEVYEYWIDWATSYDLTNWTRLAKVMVETVAKARSFQLNFADLPPFSSISFRISVFNRIGVSAPSLPTDPSRCVTQPAPPPFVVPFIEGIPGGRNTLTLQWMPLSQAYWGGPGFHYLVQWRLKTRDRSEARWGYPTHVANITDGHTDSIVVANPGDFKEWEYRIRAYNIKGGSPGWTENTSFSGQDPPTEKPSGLTSDTISARSADLIWNRVSDPPNGKIDGYKIEYWYSVIGVDVTLRTLNSTTRTKRDTAGTEPGDVPGRSRKKRETEEEEIELDNCFDPQNPCVQYAADKESQLQNLRPYKEYHVRVAAYNSGGSGPMSDWVKFVTAQATPGPPYAVFTLAYDRYCKLTWKMPRHPNGEILQYQIYGKEIIRTNVSWWVRRHIIYELKPNKVYEAKIRARTVNGWGTPVYRWFQTHEKVERPVKPLAPEVLGYGVDGVNVTFREPMPKFLRKFGGELDDDPWEYRPAGGFENEHKGQGGYPERFYVLYRRYGWNEELKKSEQRQMWGPREQTWIIIDKLEKDTLYEFATVPVNSLGEGPRSDFSKGLTGGIVPRVQKLSWYQRDWFIALIILFWAAILLFFIVLCSTFHLKNIYYEGAPKRRKDREKEKIFEPEDVDGGFNEFTLKSARSSRSVVTSRSEAPPPYHTVTNGSMSRHSGDFDDEDVTDSDDEKNEVSTYYSDEKKVPLDDLDDDDDQEDTDLATFV